MENNKSEIGKKIFSDDLKKFFIKENFLKLKEKINFIHIIIFFLLVI
jgi:hypothetical protein